MFPLSDHYFFNTLVINPAFAGCDDALSATISYRNQWVGFEDSPKSYMLTLHAPVNNDRMGLGLVVANSSIGIFKETSVVGNYAYRMALRDGKLAMGLGFGFTVYDIAWNELKATDPDDVQLMNNSPSAFLPTFSLGTYYYSKKYFVGFSIPMLLRHELDKGTGKYKIDNNFFLVDYFFTGGYNFTLSRDISILPSMLIRYHPDNAVRIDYNAQLNLKDRLWMGAGYRNNNTLVGILQCQLTYQLKLGYSYEYAMGSIGKYANGSHEIVLNYIFRYARIVTGPRHF